MTAAEDAHYEWLLSDHPDARAERDRRRQATYQSERERADQVQAWAAKIDAAPDATQAMRQLADSLGPSAVQSAARAEAAIAEPDEAFVARARDNWETYMQVSAPGGSWDYRYPARYIGESTASQPQPDIEPELGAAAGTAVRAEPEAEAG